MNPVNILAWMGVVVLGTIIAAVVGRLLFVAIAGAVSITRDALTDRRLRRAHRGLVRCQHQTGNATGIVETCPKTATRYTSTPTFFCDDHRPKSFGVRAWILDHARNQEAS